MRAEARQYLNRLSDLLFVLARVLNRANLDGLGGDDVYWHSERLARDADADRARRSTYRLAARALQAQLDFRRRAGYRKSPGLPGSRRRTAAT